MIDLQLEPRRKPINKSLLLTAKRFILSDLSSRTPMRPRTMGKRLRGCLAFAVSRKGIM